MDRAGQPRAGVGYGGEHLLFLSRNRTHGRNQIRNQVGSALQLHFYLALERVDALVECLDPVVSTPRQAQQCDGEHGFSHDNILLLLLTGGLVGRGCNGRGVGRFRLSELIYEVC